MDGFCAESRALLRNKLHTYLVYSGEKVGQVVGIMRVICIHKVYSKLTVFCTHNRRSTYVLATYIRRSILVLNKNIPTKKEGLCQAPDHHDPPLLADC
jgi:hypothetical protein